MDFLGIDFSWQDVVAILSFIASIFALLVALIALWLQNKSDKYLNRIENNIKRIDNSANQMEINIKKMDGQIDQVIFDVEKNRLASRLPKEDQSAIHKIFYENQYRFCEIKNDKSLEGWVTVRFIRESNGLPKMAYLFERKGDFPYFCVKVIKKSPDYKGDIQLNTYYYLSYVYGDKSWYMADEGHPIDSSTAQNSFKVIFAGTGFTGKGLLPASKFCKNC